MAMAKLPKYTLEKNEKKDRWDLVQDKTGRVVKGFETKAEATKGGALQKALGSGGGSVKIQKEMGDIRRSERFPALLIPRSHLVE